MACFLFQLTSLLIRLGDARKGLRQTYALECYLETGRVPQGPPWSNSTEEHLESSLMQ